MDSVILVIHLFLALGIIGLVLLQRSEGGGLGIGGGGGAGSGLTTAQGAASALTRATAIFAGFFFCTSLALGILAGMESKTNQGILEALQDTAPQAQIVEEIEVEAPQSEKPPSAPIAD